MPKLMEAAPPCSPIDGVTEILHGVPVTDLYRWLEDQDSTRTRDWLDAQKLYARSYLDAIADRGRIRERIRELLDVETYDSIQKAGNRYFFRKRLPGQEQPCIYFREGWEGADQLLIDPAERGTGKYTAVKPLRISPDGRLLLYEIKQGGERTGTFDIFDIQTRETLPDSLARGYLRGFAFSSDSKAFYYAHEALESRRPRYRAAYRHVLGTNLADDVQIFLGGEDERIRLAIVPGVEQLGLLVNRFLQKTLTDFYVWSPESTDAPESVIRDAECIFGPAILAGGRIFAITDRGTPNFRIVEVCRRKGAEPDFRDVVPGGDSAIQNWAIAGDRIFVSYLRNLQTEIDVFDFLGKRLGQLPVSAKDTVRLVPNFENVDELLFERESFTEPIQICSYSPTNAQVTPWAKRKVPFESERFDHIQTRFPSDDGTDIPMFLVGRPDVLDGGPRPAIMTSYGGYGVPMTPQFSVFVAFLLERGCLFALPNIRGGSEFGVEWHNAAKRRKRQVAFDDFVAAAKWLIQTGRTKPEELATFGGSNSGLLVAVAMTQRPDLFRAVVCIAPMLDMLRYHLFDNAHVWREEFGTSEDPDDFTVLLKYSPYHNIREGVSYPATMIISGDLDQSCNPLHARKTTALLQAKNESQHPIFLDYSRHRGHSPVLPLSERVEALTDRMAFLCDQLQLKV